MAHGFKEKEEKKKMIASEVIQIFQDNHLSFLEIEQILRLIEHIAKNRSHL